MQQQAAALRDGFNTLLTLHCPGNGGEQAAGLLQATHACMYAAIILSAFMHACSNGQPYNPPHLYHL